MNFMVRPGTSYIQPGHLETVKKQDTNTFKTHIMQNSLFIVTGKKHGQRVEITEMPMNESNCHAWIKDQNIEQYYNDVCLIPYRGRNPEFIYTPRN